MSGSGDGGGDDGTILPLLAGLIMIAFALTLSAVAASTAFLRQRDLASICDGAAVAAVQGADLAAVYAGGPGEVLPLDASAAAVEVGSYMSEVPPEVRPGWVVRVSGQRVAVGCTRTVHLPFGNLVGAGNGWTQHAFATTEAPVTG